mgnify:CR=1 FL=1
MPTILTKEKPYRVFQLEGDFPHTQFNVGQLRIIEKAFKTFAKTQEKLNKNKENSALEHLYSVLFYDFVTQFGTFKIEDPIDNKRDFLERVKMVQTMTPKKWMDIMKLENPSEEEINQYLTGEIPIRNISPLLFHTF